MDRLFVLGLTGPTGSGKGEVARLLGEKGFFVIDTDRLVRQVQRPGQPCLDALVREFSPSILYPDGTLNRKELARTAFSDPEKTKRLNAIVHPAVIALTHELLEQAQRNGYAWGVIDAPLLFESGMDKICDRTVAVTAPADRRLGRIMARDGITREQAEIRMGAQPEDSYYTGRASVVLRNDRALENLREQAAELAENLMRWRLEETNNR